MNQQLLNFINDKLQNDFSGHDLAHANRVWHNAQMIIENSMVNDLDLQVIEISCLVHDVIDEKINTHPQQTLNELKQILNTFLTDDQITHIQDIIEHLSFSKNIDCQHQLSMEGQIVQDADRLDALGAIGIARAFSYGGYNHQVIYDDSIPINKNLSQENYRKDNNTTINHFYEKLIKLPNLMNTPYAKQEAIKRWDFMQTFLDHFFQELKK